jgi:hypothetical protein
MLLVVWLLVREPRHEPREDPGEILRDRFARGEINEDEYRRATDALEAEQVTPPATPMHHSARHQPGRGQEARHD